MVRFRGWIEDAVVPRKKKKGRCSLMLTQIEGMPLAGMTVSLSGTLATIKELGRNTTDGKAVSSRDCLTGQPCPPYGTVLVEWIGDAPDPKDLSQIWVQEEVEN